ncbi:MULTISPECIES: hypothetical protein [unclassified Ruminococcus]|uniref:hypothetical protein n=1 Tax=unclassified Ruminococcus TaxID=2608920 RepID=UPI00210AE915|nr:MULTISPECIES: hypothetical protein [unclassified Ruminococcus]MCQ4022485.1 hypothetical protein [Ruminococcus sp. zg-924]MCQ4115173.1 hypothetical protein [Ruminococcus sp. zg-921]
MNLNKKIIAILAAIVSLALVVTSTVAWCLQQDITKLNKFTWTGELDQKITVDIQEDFTPWVNKDVFVVNEKDSTDPAIIRVRLEEFVKVTGGTEDVDKKAVLTTKTLNELKCDSSVSPKAVTVLFSDHTMTMEEWLAKDKPLADENGVAYWVIDTDGWCYYTKALKPGEKSQPLLDNVMKKSEEKSFLPSVYGGNDVVMDYNMNVRLQAMSVDLSSYALPEDNEEYARDWANKDGCEITKYENGYDITDNSKITDNADALVRSVSNSYKSSVKKS